MKAALIRVVENTRLYGDSYLMWLSGDELYNGAAPGQFLMLRCADPAAELASADPLLGRAMSYHRVRRGEHGPEFSILYNVVGRGTAWLARS